MAQRWALPSDVNREKATNDAIAYSCKKIGHFYNAYFLHNRFSKTSFILVYANKFLTLKNIVGAGLPPAHTASGVQPKQQWLSPKERQKRMQHCKCLYLECCISNFYTVFKFVAITSTINFVAMVKPDMKAPVSRQSVTSD